MESVKDLLTDPLKGKNRAQGVLCFLFREVLLWRRVNQIVWNKRLTAYFEKPHNQEKPDKGNLNKALLNDDLPWAGFKKAMDFLSPMEAKLVMDYTWRDGSSTTYEILIDPAADEAKQYKEIFTYEGCNVFTKAKKPVSTLAYLFRHIVAKEGVDEVQWEKLFQDYSENPVNNVGVKKSELNSTISMMKRALLDGKLSWNVFRRGILLLKPQKEVYTLKLKWTDDPHLILSMPDAEYSATIENPYSEIA
ncbi:hypothetical protein [Pseudomonas phage D6]|nr:hypothetical protein [Pseudomonas phage D6]